MIKVMFGKSNVQINVSIGQNRGNEYQERRFGSVNGSPRMPN